MSDPRAPRPFGHGSARGTPNLFGVNHRSAPIDLRERLAFTDDELEPALEGLSAFSPEAFILSTCNRLELYVVTEVPEPRAALAQFLGDWRGVPVADLEGHSYALAGEEAVRNLLRVATGLDSMVLGEAQILGQVRDAFEVAVAAGTVGRLLGRLLPLAVEVGRRARSETRIGRGSLSPSSVAVDLAKRALGDLRTRSVLVVGAGDAAQTTVRSLVDAGVAEIVVVNRSFQRALEVASAVGGRTVPYRELVEALVDADIVICSTGASEHVIAAVDVHNAMVRRGGRSLLCIDIAVPRDIDPAAAQIPSVLLYNIDDLEMVSAANLQDRQGEVAAVEAIIDDGLADYRTWYGAQKVIPTIGALYQRAESIRRMEVDRTVRRLRELSADERDLIDVMTSSIVRRLLHGPVAALKAGSDHPQAEDLARLVQELFSLDETASVRQEA